MSQEPALDPQRSEGDRLTRGVRPITSGVCLTRMQR